MACWTTGKADFVQMWQWLHLVTVFLMLFAAERAFENKEDGKRSMAP
jgi:hypothetical protein